MATAPATSPSQYTQATRPMEVMTPLGKDALLIERFTGNEALSQLFSFHIEALATNQVNVAFDKLLGQSVTVRLDTPGGAKRYFNGLCVRVSQGGRDLVFTHYRLEIVPQLWLLTKKTNTRTFQHMTVPDILRQVLQGVDTAFEIQGTFDQRDYCTQYRETDFNFVNRLMEEEGIYYFFKHENGKHTMVLANTPQSHPEVPINSKIIYETVEGGRREEDRVVRWDKIQEMRSGKHILWDHCFELPYKSLSTEQAIQETVQVGQVTHKLKVGNNDQLVVYDYPGEYAQRFDGVNSGGAPQPAQVQKIFQDNQRTVGIRIQEEAVPGIVIEGHGWCRQFVAGHKFTLQRHFNANGDYVLTSVQHEANITGEYRTGETAKYRYENSFTAIPLGLPFRPPRVTPKPFVQGTHTGVVVGPVGQEIFTDKYGRVKVQFNWDQTGTHDADSSCWVRVTQPWSGKRWGMYHIPRIGQEVIVDFLEGDPDNPIIVGTVYNADQMPAYLGDGPDAQNRHNPNISGIKTCSTPGGNGFNELRFDDTAGKEQVFVHAQHNQDTRVRNDSMENIDNNKHMIVGTSGGGYGAGDGGSGGGAGGNLFEQIQTNKHQKVGGNHFEKIAQNMQKLIGGSHDHVTQQDQRQRVEGDDNEQVNGNQKIQVGGDRDTTVGGDQRETVQGNDNVHVVGNRKVKVDGDRDVTVKGAQRETIQGDANRHVQGDRKEQVDGDQSWIVGGDRQEVVGGNHLVSVADEIHLSAKKIVLEAVTSLTVKAPGGFMDIDVFGTVIQGKMVWINSGGSAHKGTDAKPTAPDDAKPPDDAQPPTPAQNANPTPPNPAAVADTGTPSREAPYPDGQPTQGNRIVPID